MICKLLLISVMLISYPARMTPIAMLNRLSSPRKDDSNRHAESLKLATDLMLMLDGDKKLVQTIVERQSWVQEIIEERDEDVAQTVESAAKQLAKKEETTSKPYPSKAMQAAIQAVTGKSYREILDPEAPEASPDPSKGRGALIESKLAPNSLSGGKRLKGCLRIFRCSGMCVRG